MQGNGKISNSQFTSLVTLFIIGTSILLVPEITALAAKQDAWMTSILGLFLGLPIIFLYNKMVASFQEGDFFSYIDKILGYWLGKILAISFFIYFLILSALLIRQVSHFAVTQSFPETPKGIIITLFIFVVILGARYGVETLARTGELLFPWAFLLLSILLIALIPELKIERLFPILENGIKPVLLGTYSSLGLPYLELFLFLFIIPYINKPQNSGKAFYTGLLIGGVVLFLITFYAILTLGGEATGRNQFPSYGMAKTISIGNIIERIESFLAAIWFITIYMKSALTFYCTSLCLAHVFNLKEKKFLMVPLGFILIFLTLYISPNIAYFNDFITKTWTLYSGTMGVLIPLLLVTFAAFKNWKKGRVQNA